MENKKDTVECEHNEFDIKKELEEKRKSIKTMDELIAFLQDVKDNYGYGYGESPRSIAQAALATAWYFSSEFGITGFQAGFTMWDFIRDWEFSDNQCGMKIVDYDKMLYPQYDYRFEKTINKETWEALQKRAKELLKEASNAHLAVADHWKSIVDGRVPFGYKVVED